MNSNLKQMWDEVRTQKMPSHRDFRDISLNVKLENKIGLKVDPDYTSKERENVRRV
jgi:hypothetical protein